MINFTCIACGHLLQIKEYFAGCQVQCPNCKAELTTPDLTVGPADVAPSVVPSDPTEVLLPPPLKQVDLPIPESASRRPSGEPMIAIPGLLEGASVAQAIPVSLAPSGAKADSGAALPEPKNSSRPFGKPPPLDPKPGWLEDSSVDAPHEHSSSPRPPRLPVELNEEPEHPETSGKALVSLILGLCTFLIPVVCAIPAVLLAILALGDIRRQRGLLEGRGLAYAGLVLGLLGNVSLIPAWMVKVHFDHSGDEKLMRKNLEEIGKALLRYEMEKGTLPLAGIKNGQGETTLSWRVAILPYLGQKELFDEFRQNETWDSPHNKTLLARMPAVFATNSRFGVRDAASTHIQVITGPDTFFSEGVGGSTRGIVAKSKLLVVEGQEAVPWSKPEDLVYRAGGGLPKFGACSTDGFYAVTSDGVVRFVDERVDRGMLHAAINPRDRGEVFFELGPERGKGIADMPPPRIDPPIALPGIKVGPR